MTYLNLSLNLNSVKLPLDEPRANPYYRVMGGLKRTHLSGILRSFAIGFFILALTSPPSVQAQHAVVADGAPGADVIYEAGFHLGNLLPNQIDGVYEIMGLGGARLGFRFAPQTFAEFGMIMGNGEGVEWKNAHADVRMDIPVENLVGVAYLGADTIYYAGEGRSSKLVFGGHAGGGIQTQVTGSVWFRGDMKFGFSPGTSLYIGIGFVLRI